MPQHRLLRRSASESGTLCHGDGAHGRGNRCQRGRMLTILPKGQEQSRCVETGAG